MEKKNMDVVTQGVYLIGVKDDEKVNFMTAAWTTQISANPKTILVAVGKKHFTAEMIRKAGKFSINALAEGQEMIAKKCGYTSGRNTDKSVGIDYVLEEGVPIIKETAGYLSCVLKKELDEGDHILFVGTVTDGIKNDLPALIYKEKEFF